MEVGKGNLFCLARGHIVQSKVLLLMQETISGTIECNKASLCVEGCPKLKCQKLESSVIDAVVQAFIEPPKLREDKLEMMSIIDFGRVEEDVDYRV